MTTYIVGIVDGKVLTTCNSFYDAQTFALTQVKTTPIYIDKNVTEDQRMSHTVATYVNGHWAGRFDM